MWLVPSKEAVSGAVLAVLVDTDDDWLRLLVGPEVEEVEEEEEVDELGIAVMVPVVRQVTLGRGLIQHTALGRSTATERTFPEQRW